MNCPWCDAPPIDVNLDTRQVWGWGCGSCKHGGEPWQAPECRINELEAALERTEAENKRLEDEIAAYRETIAEQEELIEKLRLLFGQGFVLIDQQEPGD